MTRTRVLTAIFAFVLSMIALPAIASAQYGQPDPYGRNGGYNNGQTDPYTPGTYGNYGNNGDMRSTLRDLKQRSRELQRQIDREVDRGGYNNGGGNNGGNYGGYNGGYLSRDTKDLARQFKDAVNNMDNSYYGRNDNEVRRVMDTASQLDRAIQRSRLSYAVQNQWQAIRSDLRTLGINYNNGRGRGNGRYGNGGYGNGGYNSGKPSWWPF